MSFTPPGSIMDAADGCPSWSFKDDPVGTIKVGKVVSTEWKQAIDYKTGSPQWWNPGDKEPSTEQGPNATPVWQYVVTLDTDERRDADDDGRRKDYVKKGRNGTDLLRAAIADAGLRDLVPGATYKRAYTGSAPSSNPKYDDRKVYAWKVEAPTASLDAPAGGDPFASSAPAAPAPQQAVQQPAPVAQPAASGW